MRGALDVVIYLAWSSSHSIGGQNLRSNAWVQFVFDPVGMSEVDRETRPVRRIPP